MKKTELTAANLKNELWQTLLGIKSKKVTPATANAIAKQSREIINIVKAEISIAKLNGNPKTKTNALLG
jgi:hypothetical protein